jgi:hypothetical protein
MPLTRKVLTDQRLVVIIGSDAVGGDDIIANRQGLLNDPDFDPTFDALVDFTRVPDASLDLDSIRSVARTFILRSLKNCSCDSPLGEHGIVRDCPEIRNVSRSLSNGGSLARFQNS